MIALNQFFFTNLDMENKKPSQMPVNSTSAKVVCGETGTTIFMLI